MSLGGHTAKRASVTVDGGRTTNIVETNGEIPNAVAPEECSKLQLCCIWAFFIVLAALAVYVMIAFPQTDF
jgi:hypothetical protein